jgi:cytochrome c oxidase subunit 3
VFFQLYFALTGLHALHLIFGILAVTGVASLWARTRHPSRLRRVSAAALYWHFVDVVWVFLYPLLYLINR